MIGHTNWLAIECVGRQIGEMQARAAGAGNRQAKLLVEVAVVEITLPIDREQVAAHHVLEVFNAVRATQQLHVAVELPVGYQHRSKALDRQISQRKELVEDDAELLRQTVLVSRFKLFLRRRQTRPLRIENEIQKAVAASHAVAQRIQTF